MAKQAKGVCATFIFASVLVALASGAPFDVDYSASGARDAVEGAHAQNNAGAGDRDGILFNGLFEGDLKLTEEEIRLHYRIGDEEPADEDEDDESDVRNSTHVRYTRAALSRDGNLWPGAIIRYAIDPRAGGHLVGTIREAMEEWEDETCLRFLPRGGSSDYVYFTTENVCSGAATYECCSDSVGRKGGKQTVSLHAPNCDDKRIIMHILGHVIGFWHEESRPDRDQYISINYGNIQSGAINQFLKRNDLDVDYQGVGYDYGSIMHLPLTVYAACDVPDLCPTMGISNYAEYAQQGYPPVGHLSRITDFDGEQASHLYNCPGNGVSGRLRIYVYYGRNLPYAYDGDDPYVQVTAVDKNGNEVVRRTATVFNTRNPNWYEELQFGDGEWQFFRIRVYDDDPGNDDVLSMSETVVVQGEANERDHCLTTPCTGRVRYLYELAIGNCNPNPCQNGGTCIDRSSTYMCRCPPDWIGKHCQRRPACYWRPCQNGGTCTTHITDHDTGASYYTCSCPLCWTGTTCTTRTNPCQNGGTCNEHTNRCYCPLCWTGTTCTTRTNPCQNGGTWNEHTNRCSCPLCWTGTTCTTRTNPCQNGGTCNEHTNMCYCPLCWTGTTCSTRTNPCQNGGTWNEHTNRCSCPRCWTGTTCTTRTNPCRNGGTCNELTNGCSCPQCWGGATCTTRVQCPCRPGWIGFNCDIEIPIDICGGYYC